MPRGVAGIEVRVVQRLSAHEGQQEGVVIDRLYASIQGKPTVREHYRHMSDALCDRSIQAECNGGLPLWLLRCVVRAMDALEREAA